MHYVLGITWKGLQLLAVFFKFSVRQKLSYLKN